MTCVVAIKDHGKIYMGADSAASTAYQIRRRKDSKIFINGEFIIGYTSSYRMGQLLRYKLSPPKQKENQDVFEYMATDFVDAVRECLKSGGYAKTESGEESGGTFLVGYHGRLFTIYSDFQVAEQIGDYAAVGCGEELALGSLFSTEGMRSSPEERIRTALSAAEEYCLGVRSPFNFLALKGE